MVVVSALSSTYQYVHWINESTTACAWALVFYHNGRKVNWLNWVNMGFHENHDAELP